MFIPAQWKVNVVSSFEEGMKNVFHDIAFSASDFGSLESFTPDSVSQKALQLILEAYSDPEKSKKQYSFTLHPMKTIEIRLGYHFAWQSRKNGEFVFYTR